MNRPTAHQQPPTRPPADWRDELMALIKVTGGQVQFNQPLAPHTSFKIGGPADALLIVENEPTLLAVTKFSQNHHLNLTILGRGTNVLISDQGVRGLVVKLSGDFARIEIIDEPNFALRSTPDAGVARLASNVRLKAGAGALMDSVAETAEKYGLTGAEFLTGIPGTVGGGLSTNAGTFGHTIAELIEEVIAIRGPRLVVFSIPRSALRNEYRSPVIPDDVVVLWVIFRLKKGKPATTVSAIRQQRRLKHPSEPSAGSFFKNPQPDSAGRLIEECGLKGFKIGGAKISEKHANFIINNGSARFSDVYEIAQIVKATVEEKTGILLQEEVQVLPTIEVKPKVKREGR